MPANNAEELKIRLQTIETRKQRLDLVRGDGFHVELLDGRLQPVGHFPEAHGACKARTALECVEGTQHFVACTEVVRAGCPLPQRTAQLGQQLSGFFFKDGEQIRVDDIDGVNVIIDI